MKNKDPGFGFEVNRPHLEGREMYEIKKKMLSQLVSQNRYDLAH